MDFYHEIGSVVAICFIAFFAGSFFAFGVYYLFVSRVIIKSSYLKRLSYLANHSRGSDPEENESILESDLKSRILALRVTVAALSVFYVAIVAVLCFRLHLLSSGLGILVGFGISVCYFYSVVERQEKESACAIGRVVLLNGDMMTVTLEYGPESFRHQFDFHDNPKSYKKLEKGKMYYIVDYTWTPTARACDPSEWDGGKLPTS